MGKSKAKTLIAKRDELSSTITKYWNIIKVENKVNRSYTRNYDLKALYQSILDMTEQRALIKLKLLCINIGLKKFSDLPVDCNQYDVFKLSELREQKVQIGYIKTINPKEKSVKGKKNLKCTEIFTSSWKDARLKELDLSINNLLKKLEEFNDSAEFDDSSAPMVLAA